MLHVYISTCSFFIFQIYIFKKYIYLCSTCVKGQVNVAHNTVYTQIKSLSKGPYTSIYLFQLN